MIDAMAWPAVYLNMSDGEPFGIPPVSGAVIGNMAVFGPGGNLVDSGIPIAGPWVGPVEIYVDTTSVLAADVPLAGQQMAATDAPYKIVVGDGATTFANLPNRGGWIDVHNINVATSSFTLPQSTANEAWYFITDARGTDTGITVTLPDLHHAGQKVFIVAYRAVAWGGGTGVAFINNSSPTLFVNTGSGLISGNNEGSATFTDGYVSLAYQAFDTTGALVTGSTISNSAFSSWLEG